MDASIFPTLEAFSVGLPGGTGQIRAWRGGQGGPRVVLEAGLGCSAVYWGPVPERLAVARSVVAYDRRGLGASAPDRGRLTPESVTADLHAVVSAAGEGPVVLVGHSFGGFVIRAFAARYPELVRGLVFVDSATENELDGLSERVKGRDRLAATALEVNRFLTRLGIGKLGFVRRQAHRLFPRFSAAQRDLIASQNGAPAHWSRNRSELEAYPALVEAARQSRSAPIFARVPITVITATGYPAAQLRALEMSAERFREFHAARQANALVSLGPDVRQVLWADSGHLVAHDAPEVIVAEVERIAALASAPGS